MDTDNQQADLQNLPPTGAQQTGRSQQCKEVVKRKTKRHEYVEVDGFHFRRKRRTPATPLANAAAANSAAAAGGSHGPRSGKQSPAAVKHSLQLDDAVQPSPAKESAPAPAANTDVDMPDQVAADAVAEDLAPPGAADTDAAADAEAAEAAMDAGAGAASQQAATAAAAAAAEAAELAAAARAAAAAAAEAAAAAADLEMVEATDDPADDEKELAGAAQFTMLPSELCHLVGSFLAAELHKMPGCSRGSAQQAADSIQQQLVQQLAQRQEAAGQRETEGLEERAEGMSGGQAVPPLTVLPYQVEELKAKLVDKHSKLLQEQEAWMQLLAQYNAMTGSTPAAAEGAGSPAAVATTSPEQQQQQQGTEGAGAWGAAVMVADTPAGAATNSPGAGTTAGDTTPAPATTAAAAAEVGEDAAAAGEEEEETGPVCAEQQESLLGVQLKVEVLTALVSKMEHLVGRAEATARALQAGYRAEKFSIFPHIDSPAMLIKSLAGRGSQATQGSTQGGTQGV